MANEPDRTAHLIVERTRNLNGHHAAVIIFMVAYVSFFPFSAVHQDFARDVFIGLKWVDDADIPMQGPILAATVHMGPAWYYLLAFLIKLFRSWMFVAFGVALLGAMQFPLAYALGKELGGKFVAILWASLLLIPSWSSFEQALPLHYQITATLSLAFLFHALKFWQTAHGFNAIAMMFFLSLALHAHPTTICFAFLAIPLLIHALCAKRTRLIDVFASLGVAVLPFVPYMIFQYQNGFRDFYAAANYLTGPQIGSIWNMIPLMTSVAVGGTHYWLSEFIEMRTPWVLAVSSILIALILAGWAGLLFALRHPDQRPMLLGIVYTVVMACAVTALIRSGTPFYMTTPLHVVFLGAVAVGLGWIHLPVIRRWLPSLLAALSLGLTTHSVFAVAHMQRNGALRVAFIPIYNVLVKGNPPVRLPLLPAYAVGETGRFLCSESAPSVHGTSARQLLYDYAIEMRLQCRRADVVIGGSEANRDHLIGLTRSAQSALNLKLEVNAGSMSFVKAIPLGNSEGLNVPQAPIYPAWTPAYGDIKEQVLNTVIPAGATGIAISNKAFFVPNPSIRVYANGEEVLRTYEDDSVSIFSIKTKESDTLVNIKLASNDLFDVDAVAF